MKNFVQNRYIFVINLFFIVASANSSLRADRHTNLVSKFSETEDDFGVPIFFRAKEMPECVPLRMYDETLMPIKACTLYSELYFGNYMKGIPSLERRVLDVELACFNLSADVEALKYDLICLKNDLFCSKKLIKNYFINRKINKIKEEYGVKKAEYLAKKVEYYSVRELFEKKYEEMIKIMTWYYQNLETLRTIREALDAASRSASISFVEDEMLADYINQFNYEEKNNSSKINIKLLFEELYEKNPTLNEERTIEIIKQMT